MAEHDVDLDQMLDLATPWCLRAAATLRLADHMKAGHHDVAELAALTDTDRDALHALLGYLASKGVFREQGPGRFECNRAAEKLAQARFLGGVAPDQAPRYLAIDMRVAGGKTSTLTQFAVLARRAGLDIAAAGPQASGRFVVECRPAKENA
jgi:hypothetical protein